jgi:hypothetical protein
MNWAAQQIEMEEHEKIECSAVLPKDIYLIWKYIDKFLERSCKRSNGRHTIDTIYKQLIDNQVQLWIIYNAEEDLIKGCIVTNEVYYPTGLKMLNILQLGGKNMQDWMEIVRPILTDWAKKIDCNGIEATGRKGVSHWLTKKDSNWKEENIHFELQFEEKA